MGVLHLEQTCQQQSMEVSKLQSIDNDGAVFLHVRNMVYVSMKLESARHNECLPAFDKNVMVSDHSLGCTLLQ